MRRSTFTNWTEWYSRRSTSARPSSRTTHCLRFWVLKPKRWRRDGQNFTNVLDLHLAPSSTTRRPRRESPGSIDMSRGPYLSADVFFTPSSWFFLADQRMKRPGCTWLSRRPTSPFLDGAATRNRSARHGFIHRGSRAGRLSIACCPGSVLTARWGRAGPTPTRCPECVLHWRGCLNENASSITAMSRGLGRCTPSSMRQSCTRMVCQHSSRAIASAAHPRSALTARIGAISPSKWRPSTHAKWFWYRRGGWMVLFLGSRRSRPQTSTSTRRS